MSETRLMTRRDTEAGAGSANDEGLRAASWDPLDKSHVRTGVPDENPPRLIRELLDVEHAIASGPEKLLKEIEE